MGSPASETTTAPPSSTATRPIVLRAARLFDGERLVDEPVVAIEGSTITAVGNAPADADVRDLGDVTLLPGLIDAHQHLVFDGNGTFEDQVTGRTDDELRDRARANAQKALRAGITTIRDLGDRAFVTLDLRGDPDLPTILAAGPPITAPGGHCWFLGGECEGEAGLLAAVAERAERGCDVVKVMVTGGTSTPTYPIWSAQFTTEQLAAAIAAAHEAGLPVATHCHGTAGIEQALAISVDTIEHCTFMTETGIQPDHALIEQLAASGTAISATLGRLPGQQAPPAIEEGLARLAEAIGVLRSTGATVIVGTDAGIAPGKPHDVLPWAAADLVEIGLAPAEVLTTLTTTAAGVIGVGDRKGRLAPGFDADVLAVDGNPLDDPAALFAVRAVWRGGREVAR